MMTMTEMTAKKRQHLPKVRKVTKTPPRARKTTARKLKQARKMVMTGARKKQLKTTVMTIRIAMKAGNRSKTTSLKKLKLLRNFGLESTSRNF